MAAAAAAVAGSLLGAGGQIYAAESAKNTGGDGNNIFSTVDPFNNAILAGTINDASTLIGRGNLFNEPLPLQELIGRIQSLAVNDKTKRRALDAIRRLREADTSSFIDPAFVSDRGRRKIASEVAKRVQSTASRLRVLQSRQRQTGVTPITEEEIQRQSQAAGSDFERAHNLRVLRNAGLTPEEANARLRSGEGIASKVQFSSELRGVLTRLGVSEQDFADIFSRQEAEQERRDTLAPQLQEFQDNTILNRARGAQTASQLIADASGFASSGTPQTEFQQSLLDRINRGIEDQRGQVLRQANFGGFNPGGAIQGLDRQQTDAPFTAIEQALAASLGITGALGGGLELAQTSAAQAGNLQIGAAGIAAQQASAANQIRNSQALQSNQIQANAISGAFSSLGSGLTNAALINQFSNQNQTPAFNLNTNASFTG